MPTLNSIKRKAYREEFKVIESVLHPVPVVNGIEVLHEHRKNGDIVFTAWKSNLRLNNREVYSNRNTVLSYHEFPLSDDDVKWLIETENKE